MSPSPRRASAPRTAYWLFRGRTPLLLVAALLGAVMGAMASTQDARADEAAATRAVIEQQLEAFSRDAWEEAYAFAAPNIKAIFPNADVFAGMVQRGYPMVWRPSSVEFLDSGYHRDVPETGVYEQRLRLVDQQGAPFIALYTLQQVDGVWRITGVLIRREEAFSA